ncbi:unnamed protein product [Brassicogethes aeneus]|uniref:G-protein coupled receptors family 2 profile 1 domain-containing protein n=1 Tax=Brassicogethes aeneus TaxID=1431903 RepID=A0A9P0FGV9_BRAAE|nr:unnamed protein product [Brassicogethes aeneus]
MSNLFDANWSQDAISPVDHDSNNLWSYEGSFNMNDTEEEPKNKKLMNITYCSALHRNRTDSYVEKYGDQFCKVTTDTVSCWPPTLPNHKVLVKCFDYLDGIFYDTTHKRVNKP